MPQHCQFRGSRKHILDLLDRPDYVSAINELLSDTGATISASDVYQPRGHSDSEEWTMRRFAQQYLSEVVDCRELNGWWVDEQYKNPTWDLLSTCTVARRKGILLVEAKAHEAELRSEGKALGSNASEQAIDEKF